MQAQSATIKLSFDTQHNEWRMAVNQGVAQGPGHYQSLPVPKDQTAVFTFQILNPQGVTFAATDPFAAKPGGHGKSDFGDQFDVTGAGTRTLVVNDMNGQKLKKPYAGGDYYYELHFSNAPTLDPVISNGGCCNAAPPQNNITYLALGVVALLVLYVLLVRPMMARNTRVDSDQG